jgi:hypothetical protein
MTDMNDRMQELERKSRAAFDDSVESLDAATRSRLARARAQALEELQHRRAAWSTGWLPAGAAAGAALVAAMLWVGGDQGTQGAPPALSALEDLDIVAGGEDLAMFGEDEEFYAWAADQVQDGVG